MGWGREAQRGGSAWFLLDTYLSSPCLQEPLIYLVRGRDRIKRQQVSEEVLHTAQSFAGSSCVALERSLLPFRTQFLQLHRGDSNPTSLETRGQV